MSSTVDYEIRCVNPSDYELDMTFSISNRIMSLIFAKSKKKLSKKGLQIEKSPDDVKEFNVDPRFMNLLETSLTPQIKKLKAEIKSDNIEIITYRVIKACFKKFKDGWKVCVYSEGEYLDKR